MIHLFYLELYCMWEKFDLMEIAILYRDQSMKHDWMMYIYRNWGKRVTLKSFYKRVTLQSFYKIHCTQCLFFGSRANTK